jgi:hypothetical protein
MIDLRLRWIERVIDSLFGLNGEGFYSWECPACNRKNTQKLPLDMEINLKCGYCEEIRKNKAFIINI